MAISSGSDPNAQLESKGPDSAYAAGGGGVPVEQASAWLAAVAGPVIDPIELPRKVRVCLGRGRDCDRMLPDPAVSRTHAEVFARDDGWHIRDLDSRHGTLVNGFPVKGDADVLLRESDLVAIGPWTLRVSIPDGSTRDRLSTFGATRDLAEVTQIVSAESEDDQVFSVDEASLGELARQRLGVLLDCAAMINAEKEEHRVAHCVVESALAGTGYGRAALLRTTDTWEAHGENSGVAGIELIAALVRGAEGGDHRSTSFPVSATLVERASSGHPARLSTAHESDRRLHGRSVEELGIHAALCVPIEVGEKVDSFLYLDARQGEDAAASDAAEFCVGLAKIAGLAIANRRRDELERKQLDFESQLGAARRAQQLIVPAPKGAVGVMRYSLRMRPGMYVAGDLFDILALPGRRVAFFLGDVTGEGIGAGILMAGAQSHLHASLLHYGDPADAVNEVNYYLASHSPPDRFISLWVGVLDPEKCELTYVDAGHGYCVLKRRDEDPVMMKNTGGIPAAIEPDVVYESATVPLAVGDRIVLFSDGVVEQTRAEADFATAGTEGEPGKRRREDFGLDRVMRVVSRSKNAEEDTRKLLAAVLDYAQTLSLSDDTTIASIEWADGAD
ncbi:MAG: SpoIIE family protein phosphatase [Planctomycetota bacterium]